MALRTRLFLALSAALLASCAERGLQAPCNAGVCKASVEVQSCEDGGLSVAPDPILVPAPNKIEWTIATAGFRFAPNGIVIDGTGFRDPQLSGDGRKFTVHDDHSDKRPKIKYTVRVVRESDSLACKAYDPYIKNQ